MKTVENLTKVEVLWEGPLSTDKIKTYKTNKDYGLYQIYGTHEIFGPNSLLYLGQASDQPFATRLSQHEDWLKWQSSEIQIFIGRLGGTKKVKEKERADLVDKAEKLLLYYITPPYNTQNLNSFGNIKNTIVLNHGRKNRLPLEVSTFYHDSECGTSKWMPYQRG